MKKWTKEKYLHRKRCRNCQFFEEFTEAPGVVTQTGKPRALVGLPNVGWCICPDNVDSERSIADRVITCKERTCSKWMPSEEDRPDDEISGRALFKFPRFQETGIEHTVDDIDDEDNSTSGDGLGPYDGV